MDDWTALASLVGLIQTNESPQNRIDWSDWEASDWRDVLHVADRELLLPALRLGLLEAGRLNAVPAPIRELLDAVRRLTGERNRKALDMIDLLGHVAQTSGGPVVLLKGAANLVNGVFPDPAAPIFMDIDVLVAPGDVAAFEAALGELGFEPRYDGEFPPDMIHGKPLYHDAHPFRIEVHHALVQAPYAAALPAEDMIAQARTFRPDAPLLHIPSPAHHLLHTALESALDEHPGRPRKLYNLARCLHRFGGDFDAQSALGRCDAVGLGTALRTEFASAAFLFGGTIPSSLLLDARGRFLWAWNFIGRAREFACERSRSLEAELAQTRLDLAQAARLGDRRREPLAALLHLIEAAAASLAGDGPGLRHRLFAGAAERAGRFADAPDEERRRLLAKIDPAWLWTKLRSLQTTSAA